MADATPQDQSLEDRVRDVVETIRPYIQGDGGDIEYIGIENNIAQVRLKGACSGCPHAAMTLQMGVERLMRERVPEIKGVENVG